MTSLEKRVSHLEATLKDVSAVLQAFVEKTGPAELKAELYKSGDIVYYLGDNDPDGVPIGTELRVLGYDIGLDVYAEEYNTFSTWDSCVSLVNPVKAEEPTAEEPKAEDKQYTTDDLAEAFKALMRADKGVKPKLQALLASVDAKRTSEVKAEDVNGLIAKLKAKEY